MSVYFADTIRQMQTENQKIEKSAPEQTEEFKDRIINHPVLGYFYNESPKKTVLNICSYALQSDGRIDFAKEKANKLYDNMRFNLLYSHSKADWDETFKNMFKRMQSNFRPFTEGERIVSFIVEKDVEKIPERLWVIPSKNQKIKKEEFMFILKTLDYKILKNWSTKRKDYYMLPQNWFLNEDAKKKYYEKTKRRVNRHKISRITELLFEYKLIIKYQPWDKKTNKMKPIVYKLGDENFYKRRITIV